MLKVLVACEESQRVCTAFRELGHEAYSCDILEPSGGHEEWHIQGDVLEILNPKDHLGDFEAPDRFISFRTMDGKYHEVQQWDIIIAHPPCTYLTVTGNRWFNVERYGDKAIERHKLRAEAAEFFMKFANAECKHICIENPVGYMSTHYRPADQCIQPYMFGDPFEKKTCLWLKNLPKLQPTNIVKPPPRMKFESGRSMPAWYAEAWHLPEKERAKLRSQTFKGIAQAIAKQFSSYVICEVQHESIGVIRRDTINRQSI